MKTKHTYVLHLVGGDTIEAVEETDQPVIFYLLRLLQAYKPNELYNVVTPDNGQALIPVRNILYITTDEPYESEKRK